MGVKGLWKVLEPVRERVAVSNLRGAVLAVDLAIWVVQAETLTNNQYDNFYLRQLFYKINHLLENGVGVVVVTDGKAPHLKAETMARRLGVQLDRNSKIIQRRRFLAIMRECTELCTSLGIPVLAGDYEAEAAAAKLQEQSMVDGVITTDGDAFLYGARKVYRNLLVTEPCCDCYDMSRVERELGLSRDDLLGFAILSGCDYNPDGVSGLGRPTILKYIAERERIRDISEEIASWGEKAAEIGEKWGRLKGIKAGPHCSVCKHAGSKKEHGKGGCPVCLSTPCTPSSSLPCQCTKHTASRLLSSAHMTCCVRFVATARKRKIPVREIATEFRNQRPIPPLEPSWLLPPSGAFVRYMGARLQWRPVISAEKFAQVAALHLLSGELAYSHGYHTASSCPAPPVSFSRILKARRKGADDLLELEFSVTEPLLRQTLDHDTVYLVLPTPLVEHLLPAAVEQWREGGAVAGKRRKKEVIPIYDRYPVKKPEQQVEPARPKTARKKGRSPKKSKKTAVSPLTKVESLPESDEEMLPLSERLKLRRERRENEMISSQSSLTVSSQTSIASSEPVRVGLCPDEGSLSPDPLQSPQTLSPPISPTPDHETPEPLTPDPAHSPLTPDPAHSPLTPDPVHSPLTHDPITVPSPEDFDEDDGYIDSDVQLLPQSFMEEYLDLSRDEILGIAPRGEDSLVARQQHLAASEESLVAKEEESLVAKEGESLVAWDREEEEVSLDKGEMVEEEEEEEEEELGSYRERISGQDGQYHTICFTTPAKPSTTLAEPPTTASIIPSEGDSQASPGEAITQPAGNPTFQMTDSLAALCMSDLEESAIEEPISGVEESISGVKEPVSGIEESISGIEESISGVEKPVSKVEESGRGKHEDPEVSSILQNSSAVSGVSDPVKEGVVQGTEAETYKHTAQDLPFHLETEPAQDLVTKPANQPAHDLSIHLEPQSAQGTSFIEPANHSTDDLSVEPANHPSEGVSRESNEQCSFSVNPASDLSFEVANNRDLSLSYDGSVPFEAADNRDLSLSYDGSIPDLSIDVSGGFSPKTPLPTVSRSVNGAKLLDDSAEIITVPHSLPLAPLAGIPEPGSLEEDPVIVMKTPMELAGEVTDHYPAMLDVSDRNEKPLLLQSGVELSSEQPNREPFPPRPLPDTSFTTQPATTIELTESLAALAMSDLEESLLPPPPEPLPLSLPEQELSFGVPDREPFKPKPLPDTSFLARPVEVAPTWQKKPLSAISSSTPRSEGRKESITEIRKPAPLPGISDENTVPNFSLNVTELLESSTVDGT